MKILLVRHGETHGNVAHRHQEETTTLTKKGKEQARVVAEKIKDFVPTHLVTSNLVRTIETAHIIGDANDLVPDTNHHLIELVRPDKIYGHYHRSLDSVKYYITWFFGKTTTGESYADLRQRIERAKESLAQYPEDACVVVVSHSIFINMFVAHLCSDEKMSFFKAFFVFRNITSMPNTHITPVLLEAEVTDGVCAWSVDT